jgi:hypothetical protein
MTLFWDVTPCILVPGANLADEIYTFGCMS